MTNDISKNKRKIRPRKLSANAPKRAVVSPEQPEAIFSQQSQAIFSEQPQAIAKIQPVKRPAHQTIAGTPPPNANMSNMGGNRTAMAQNNSAQARPKGATRLDQIVHNKKNNLDNAIPNNQGQLDRGIPNVPAYVDRAIPNAQSNLDRAIPNAQSNLDKAIPNIPAQLNEDDGLVNNEANATAPNPIAGVPIAGAPVAPPKSESMFAPLADMATNISEQDLAYVSEVDAALARKPAKGIILLSTAVILFFAIMIIWAAFAAIDEVTHAEGQVISSQRTQSIQNLEGGILQEILVKEGQIVNKDTPLARLDNMMADSSYRDAFNKMLDHQVAIIRLEAELNETIPVFPTNMAKQMEGLTKEEMQNELKEKVAQVISDHKTTYKARLEQRRTELNLLQEQFEQKQSEINEQLARKKSLERSLTNSIAQRDLAYPLLKRRIYSRADFLKLEQSVISLQGDIETLAAAIPRTQAAASEAKGRILFREAELNASITEEINKRRTEYNSLHETLSAGKDRVARTELRSPVYGTVKQIYINSIGGVVKPGESIMEIVPLDDSLLIEARIRPQDIAFLHAGQKAVVKISAYDFSIYGGLDGNLETISADTIEDKQGNFFYLVKVRTPKTKIEYRNEKLPIMPGMIATVDILTGKKTVLSYLLKPIIKAKQNALRER